MDTSTGCICQCCGGIKSEGGETIAVKSELVEIKKERDSGDIENRINVSLDEKVKTEESDIDTKSWQHIAENPEGSVKPEENEDKQNFVCNTCGGTVVKTEKDTDTKLMIPLLGTLHITPTSRDLSLEVGIDNSEVYPSAEQDVDTGVAVCDITPVMQDQVEPIVIQPESMASDNECPQEQSDQQTCTASEGNAGGEKAREAGKNTVSMVAEQLGTNKPIDTEKVQHQQESFQKRN